MTAAGSDEHADGHDTPTSDFEPLLDLDELLVDVVDCCRDLAAVRLGRGGRDLLMALSELMSIEVMLEGVQRRLTERIDSYFAEGEPGNPDTVSRPAPRQPPRGPTRAPAAGAPRP